MKRGYQLSTLGSGKKLEKLTYNDGTGTWTAISPYPSETASDIMLPSGASFAYYCSPGAACSFGNENALYMCLSGWEFYTNASGGWLASCRW